MNPIAQRLDQTATEINNLVYCGDLQDVGYVWRDLMRAARDEIEALSPATPPERQATSERPRPWNGVYAIETNGVSDWAVYHRTWTSARTHPRAKPPEFRA